MTFISYAQNFEDVMLWRALKHVENGFYIDVGAGHPDTDSVTRAFFDRGWSGINVEPSAELYTRLAAARGRDTNLNLVLGSEPRRVTFFEIPSTGLSTLDAEIAAVHSTAGWTVNPREIEQMSLTEVCRRHAPAEIQFLKVDTEGSERSVLAGADFGTFRPWIVVAESTLPLSQEQNYSDWEDILISAGYRSAWFDGLNRFYIVGERWETLSGAFTAPPNVFDDFIRAIDTMQLNKIVDAETRATEATARAMQAEARVQTAERLAAEATNRATQAEAHSREVETRAAEAMSYAARADARVAAATGEAIAARARAAEGADRAKTAEAAVLQARSCEARLAAKRDKVAAELSAVYASTSWRLTSPLRGVSRALRRANLGRGG